MKTILDSIIKVEQNLQKQRMEAQKEADEIKSDTNKKISTMEQQIDEDFEKNKTELQGKIEKESEAYAEKLLNQAQEKISRRRENMAAVKDKIKKQIIDTVLNEGLNQE